MKIESVILAIMFAIILVCCTVYVKGFKNWLVWAVTEAEVAFGSGTGQLKLRYAYELAVNRFPILAKLIPFSIFSKMVDEALKVMRTMIENNVKIADVVVKQEEDPEEEPSEIVE